TTTDGSVSDDPLTISWPHTGIKTLPTRAAANTNANTIRTMIASLDRHGYLLLLAVEPDMSRPECRGPVSLALCVAAPVKQCAAVDIGPLVIHELVSAQVRYQD